MRVPDPPLLIVTDRRQARRPLPDVVAAALKAGCRWISVREKDLPADEQVLLARSLISITRRQGAKLTVHGDATLAAAAGADGVHLPAGSDPAAARALLGRQKLIGVSIHTVTEAENIDPSSVDYVLAGPAFETASKPGYGPELGRKGLAAIARATSVPVLAIGGINTARIADLIAEGAARRRRHGLGDALSRSGARNVRASVDAHWLARYPRARYVATPWSGTQVPGRQLSRLPEYVDRHAAARMEITADAQPLRFEHRDEFLADAHCAFFVEGAVIAEAVQIEFQRFRFHEPRPRHVIDDESGEVGLAGDRADRGEFREGKARDVVCVRMRVAHAIEHRLAGRGGNCRGAAELQRLFGHESSLPAQSMPALP